MDKKGFPLPYKQATFEYDEDRKCYTAHFRDYDDNTFSINMSYEKVMEHIKRSCKNTQLYDTDKSFVFAHFRNIAKSWFRLSKGI